MKQILLVLRKDCRKFWPEILLTLAMTCAFVWLSPYQWRNPSVAAPHWFALDWERLQLLSYVVEALLPVSWLIIISRVVHDENLVGNRQFWLTRPYRWQSLLAEKLLFIGLFVGVPFIAAQVCLLIGAGFSPKAYLINLAVAVVLVAGAIVVPMVALAAVTRNLLSIIGTLLTIAIFLAMVAFFASGMTFGPAVSIPYSDRITIPIIIAFGGAVLVAQYSARKLWLSRTLLAILCVTVGGLAMQPFAVSLLERIYQLPYPGHANPIVVRQDLASKEGITAFTWKQKAILLSIPIQASQIPSEGQVTPDDIRVTIDTPDGYHWTSPWQAVENHRLSAASPRDRLPVEIDQATFDRIQSSPITLHVAIAFTQLAIADATTVSFDAQHDMPLPHIGICAYDRSDGYLRNDFSCRAAFHLPALTRITVVRTPFPCADPASRSDAHPDETWLEGPLHVEAATLDLSPIRTLPLQLASYQPVPSYVDSNLKLSLCPGTPITVTSFRLVRRFQYQLDLPVEKLPPLTNIHSQM